jgi:hypothetical protein
VVVDPKRLQTLPMPDGAWPSTTGAKAAIQ